MNGLEKKSFRKRSDPINLKTVNITVKLPHENTSEKSNFCNLNNLKKHNRTSPDVQFKEFSLTKRTTRPRTDYE